MRRKLRIFSHIAIICLSVCMFAFGVYAASTVSVTTSGTVSFTAQNVEATVTRTVSGCDETKSTFGNGSKTYTQVINNTTTPEGATYTYDQLKEEQLFFANNKDDIIMEFTITNNSSEKDLFVKLTDNETRACVNAYKAAETLDGEYIVHPGLSRTFRIFFCVNDVNKSATLYYNYNIELNCKTTAVFLDENYLEFDGGAITGFKTGVDLTKLTNIILPAELPYDGDVSTVKCIGDLDSSTFSFSALTNLENVIFYDRTIVNSNSSWETIGDEVFKNCTKLKSIILPSSITAIGDSAFNGCSSLKSFSAYDCYLSELGSNVFEGCSFKVLTMGQIDRCDGPFGIGGSYDYDSTSSCVVYMSESLSDYMSSSSSWNGSNTSCLFSLGTNLYLNGEHIVDITVDSLTSSHCMTFDNVDSLRSVVVSCDIEGAYVFANCDNLSYVEFTEGVEKIECYGWGENIKTVKFPSTLTTLYSDCFNGPSSGGFPYDATYIYAGTIENWKTLVSNNTINFSGITIQCSDGSITGENEG